jgi:hypothetical protein
VKVLSRSTESASPAKRTCKGSAMREANRALCMWTEKRTAAASGIRRETRIYAVPLASSAEASAFVGENAVVGFFEAT